MLSKIVMTFVTVLVLGSAVLSQASAGPRGSYIYSPYGAGMGSPQTGGGGF
jgi:hypothetical protein